MERTLIDLGSADAFTGGVPYELFAELRHTDPVVWVDEVATDHFAGGPGFWAVLRHADVMEASRQPAVFSSWEGTSFLRDPDARSVVALRQMMLNMDPPEHSRLRSIVSRVFTPKMVASLHDAVGQHAREVIDSAARLGDVIDFVDDVAAEMALRVLAHVMGIPSGDRGLLYDWTNRLVGDSGDVEGDPDVVRAVFVEMFGYAAEQTTARRAEPSGDIWSLVANAEVDGEHLTTGELNSFFLLLSSAGNETTRNLISGGLVTLDDHPEQRARLVEDLPRLLPGAVEEMLRFHPPIIQFRRTAVADAELGGQRVASGDKVVLYYPSANRDEAVFDAPDSFDLARDPNPHLSFGVGPHFCLGANLARLEARCLFQELFTRFPQVELAGPAVRQRSNMINGYRHLPVRLGSEAGA